MSIDVHVLDDRESVRAIAADWLRLADGNPFLRWDWLGTWWDAFANKGTNKRLMVLVACQDNHVMGIAPLYIEERLHQGPTVSCLGAANVGPRPSPVLAEPQDAEPVAQAMAEWLIDHEAECGWRHVELVGAIAADPATRQLQAVFANQGYDTYWQPGGLYADMELPNGWDAVKQRQSFAWQQEHETIRQWIHSGELAFYEPKTLGDLEDLWFTFVDLYRFRCNTENARGGFGLPGWGEFLWNATERMLAANSLCLTFALTRQGDPIAAQYAVVNDQAYQVYLSGVNPAYRHWMPGAALLYQTIQTATAAGLTRYRIPSHAIPNTLSCQTQLRPTSELRIAGQKVTSRMFQSVWHKRTQFSRWAQQLVNQHSGTKSL